MINSLTIKNFETHLDTEVELHPGVNSFVGESDEGKSGIVRSIKWNAQNRPQGDSYRNDVLDPKKKEDKLKATEVGIVYEGTGLVTRARDGFAGGVNHYVIDQDEPLRALRTDVPDEVRDVTQMKEVNIQGQHPTEQYFLLADKPGQVAKQFNKVAGLTIMDKATADINSQVRTCNAEINVAKEEIDNRKEELEDTLWVVDAEKLAKKLADFQNKMMEKALELEVVEDTILDIDTVNKALQKFDGLKAAKISIGILEKQTQEINDTQATLDSIEDLIYDASRIDLELSSTTDIEKALNVLNELKTFRTNIEEDEELLGNIDSLLGKIDYNDKELKIAERKLTEARIEYTAIRENYECPTCGRTGK